MGDTPISFHPSADKTVVIDILAINSPLYQSPRTPQEQKIKEILENVRSYVNRIDIYENVFSPTLTGELEFRDYVSLSNLGVLRGLDTLSLQFSIPDKKTGKFQKYGTTDASGNVTGPFKFALYSQSNRATISQSTEEFKMGICSIELLASVSRKLSKSYINKKPEDIVRDIVQKPYGLASGKPLTVQPTPSPINFIVPYMRPLEALQLLTLQAQSEEDKSNYVFFETLNQFYFGTLQNLVKRAFKSTDDYKTPVIYVELSGNREIGNTPDVIKAEQLQLISGFDMLYVLSRGYFSSVTIAPDVLAGVCGVDITAIGADDIYDNRQMLNPFGSELYPSILGKTTPPTSRMFLVPTTAFIAEDKAITQLDPSIKNNFFAQTIGSRNRELLGLQIRCIRGRVAGAPNLHAGHIIKIHYPTSLNNVSSDKKDFFQDLATGRYIIINAKHSIVADGKQGFFYETTFEAVTDSFAAKALQYTDIF